MFVEVSDANGECKVVRGISQIVSPRARPATIERCGRHHHPRKYLQRRPPTPNRRPTLGTSTTPTSCDVAARQIDAGAGGVMLGRTTRQTCF